MTFILWMFISPEVYIVLLTRIQQDQQVSNLSNIIVNSMLITIQLSYIQSIDMFITLLFTFNNH